MNIFDFIKYFMPSAAKRNDITNILLDILVLIDEKIFCQLKNKFYICLTISNYRPKKMRFKRKSRGRKGRRGFSKGRSKNKRLNSYRVSRGGIRL